MTRVLVACSGDNTGLNFVRSLRLVGDYEVIGLDFHLDDFHASEADFRYLADADSVIHSINQLADQHELDLLYVADTGSVLDEVARRRGDLAVKTLLPDQAELEITEDKWRTCVQLRQGGVAVPDTVLVTGREDLIRLFGRHPEVWLRRRWGSGGYGAIGTADIALAQAWLEGQHGWGHFTAAERLTERTATFSGLWLRGELVASQLRERLGWKYSARSPSGVTGITGAQRSLWDPDLHLLALEAVRTVAPQATGAFGVDFTYSADGRALVTEVQPARFYSSIYFLARAGLNLPDLYCRLACGDLSNAQTSINPIRDSLYWLKAVDKEPALLTEAEYFDVRTA